MNARRHDEEGIFHAARQVADPEARAAYLVETCGDDAALRGRVERLLRVCEQEPSFLAGRACAATAAMPAAAEPPGTAVGPYKLLEPIGEGGMGAVYMAEQTEPVRRRVALKVVKPGMDSKQVVARFEAERQALAMMDHPNIAKVHDAGVTPEGRPYFVMELVRGLPITEYCDQHRLTIPERLELFVLVCRAVQHAHQKGVIHRDLKPSNVLVADVDGAAVPKVIDFGVAKATGQSLTEKTFFTGFHQFVGTPLYASPEQAGLSGADVDTRSDVYSLGVLLYELLTGATPFNSETLRRASFDEMLRIVREEEPPKPSTRLGTLGERLSTISAQRRADPKRLGISLVGELDWVVMKALEKDRRRRYETVGDFAADVQRYLSDQPVEACPPSRRYRLAKYVRRNRAALTTAALVGLALVAGTAASLWQAVRATRAGALAERREVAARDSADEARAVLDFFIRDVLGSAAPETALGRDLKVSEALAEAEKALGTAFAGQPLAEAGVRAALVRTYSALGRYDIARSHSARALDLRRRLLGPEHPDTLRSSAAEAVLLCETRSKIHEAIQIFERVLAAQRRTLGPEHHDTLHTMSNMAVALSLSSDYDEARKLHNRVLEVQNRVLGPEHRDTLATMMNAAWAAGDRDEARRLMQDVLEVERRVLGPDHPSTLRSMNSLATWHRIHGEFDEAVRLLGTVLDSRRAILGPTHPDTLGTYYQLAFAFWEQGQDARAIELLVQTLDAQRRVPGPLPTRLGTVYLLAELLTTSPAATAGDRARGFEFVRAAIERDPKSGMARQALGWLQYRAGDWKGCLDSLEGDSFVTAMAHWRLGEQLFARSQFIKENAWLVGYEQRWEERRRRGVGETLPTPKALRLLRAEAAALLGIEPPPSEAKAPEPATRPRT